MAENTVICVACRKQIRLGAIEQLMLKRGQLDGARYKCPDCTRRSTNREVQHYGLPLPYPSGNEYVLSHITFPLPDEHATNIRLKDTPAIRQALAKYQLFAFVLFDVNVHTDMQSYLTRRYEMLDEDTGEHLLFFSYFQPTPEWITHRRIQTPALADMWEVHETDNPQLSIDMLKMQLHIDTSQLPCLVVTTSLFEVVEPIILPIKTTDIAEKLMRLAGIANNLANDTVHHHLPNSILMQNIAQELTQTFGDTVRRHALASIQKSLFGMLDVATDATPETMMESIRQKSVELQRVRSEIHALYASTDSDEFQLACIQIDETCDLILNWLQISTPHVSQSATVKLPKLDLPKDVLEAHSARYIETYGELARVYTHIMQSAQAQIDYAPFVISLTKLFELEINMSIVQLIRYIHDIEMPTYYNKYQHGKTVIIGEHNFNKLQHDRLRLPGIGQSYYVVKQQKDDIRERYYKLLLQAGYKVSKPTWNRKFKMMLEKWDKINPRRNHVAHPDPVTFQEVEEIVTLLNDVGDGFEYLAALKRVLSTQARES